MARARTSGAGWVILRKLRGPSPHPEMEAGMTITTNAAAKRFIPTLLFHEQPLGEVRPDRTVCPMPKQISGRLGADSRQNWQNRQRQSQWRAGTATVFRRPDVGEIRWSDQYTSVTAVIMAGSTWRITLAAYAMSWRVRSR